MNFVFGFFIVSLVACILLHVVAFIAEKVNKKKMEKVAKEIKQ